MEIIFSPKKFMKTLGIGILIVYLFGSVWGFFEFARLTQEDSYDAVVLSKQLKYEDNKPHINFNIKDTGVRHSLYTTQEWYNSAEKGQTHTITIQRWVAEDKGDRFGFFVLNFIVWSLGLVFGLAYVLAWMTTTDEVRIPIPQKFTIKPKDILRIEKK